MKSCLSITWTVSPPTATQRLTRSSFGSSGERKTTMSPRCTGRNGSSCRLRAGRRRAVDEPVDEQVVADEEGVLHRAARDVEGLHDEGVREQQEHRGDDQRLEVFAPDRPFASCPPVLPPWRGYCTRKAHAPQKITRGARSFDTAGGTPSPPRFAPPPAPLRPPDPLTPAPRRRAPPFPTNPFDSVIWLGFLPAGRELDL